MSGSDDATLSPRAALALAKAKAYQDQADAPATKRAYASDVRIFENWCAKAGLPALPASPEVVGAFLAAAGEGFAQRTLRRRVAAIARASALAGAPLDTKHPAIRETLRGIAQAHTDKTVRRAAAITTDDIRKMVATCAPDVRGSRDRALVLVGFAAALRRSEIAALVMRDVKRQPSGLTLVIRRSKTDQEGEGEEVAVLRGERVETCPVRAVERWLELAQIAEGPVFRKVARGGHVQARGLSGDGVRQIVRRVAAAAGLRGAPDEYLSTHGLRAGFVTSAYANDASDEEIMGQTRHRSLTTMRSYVRRAKLGKGNVSGKVGL